VIEPESSGERQGAFVATAEGWRFQGTLTMDTAAAVMASADALPLPETGRVDLGGLVQGDSAALAVIMALRRRASSEKRELRVENIPKALLSLAVAYGVDDITHGTA
jgi:phospholipid transport system transporter-binding protein